MRRSTLSAVLALSLMALSSSPSAYAADESVISPGGPTSSPTAKFDPDHLLVRFKIDANPKSISKILAKYKMTESTDLGDESNITMYDVGTSASPTTVATEMKNAGLVELAEPDYNLHPTSISNDSQVDQYWGLQNTGQNIGGQVGINDVDVDAPDAWATANGAGVIVAVIDEGIDINHPELSSHIWTNTADCNNNGIDDDNDGYVDDCNGWDFYHNDKTVYDSADGDDHGTHVAGTIAASLNNNFGGAGVAPNVTVMPLKFLGPSGGSTSDAILAIAYAKAHGAKIVNCSWGGTGYSQALSDAIANSGMLFTVAAGNSGANIAVSPQYPAALNLPNIISVAAVDNRGALASFSNYGGTTSVGAPGVNILSTIPKKQAETVALEASPGASSWKSAYWGFGLEAVVGATNRRNMIAAELGRLGATSTSPILLVDDDESSSGSSLTPDTASYYTAALTAAGFTNVTTTSVTRDTNGPSAATMLSKYVIWETGYAVGTTNINTLTNTDLTNLTTFLNANGKLLVAGADAIWRNESATFVQNYLGVSFVSEGDTRTAASGVASTVYAGMTFDLSGSESPKASLNPYQDIVTPQSSQAKAIIQLNADANYNQAFEYKNGTSMAAPHVAGIAALCAQIMPNASAVQLANYVKGGVTPLSSLSGKATTGGMVNAGNSVRLAMNDAHPPTDGYRFAASDGGIFAFGNASFQGSTGGQKLNEPVVGMASTPSRSGYWLVARDGGIFGFGAPFKGSAGAIKLNQPIVGMAPTPSGGGYWLVASDGGIFAYGDASFRGSTGNIKLNSPIVAMAATPSGNGYWLVSADGGIFAYGDASFYGSAGGSKLNHPIVGMTPTPSGRGYWLVSSDGGIFAFGDAMFFGSTGAIKLNKPIVGMSHTPSGFGYWLVASDGGVFAYGDAAFYGSTGAIKLNQPIVGMAH